MKFYLLSDNIDTMMGMRLAGIEGKVVHGREEVSKALDEAMEMENVGIVLMTEIALKQCPEKVMDYKLNRATPLIVEIPDRHATANISDTISKYLAEAVGIKL
ncbi:V-type ATP synthase subunit F [uncultured Ruminococcus sp.]|uniref:V-type ATP synthase subunit F n=1 Tax=uncultured Ruminococcus sp. TaxID=165186 RepID=UPI0025FDCEA6|nr:V-type ATP synthase subunit F [uncultured Ruminococcus sp.]MBQ1538263.1 V-type ATP synthase subunit F [Ruminococcus sp.]